MKLKNQGATQLSVLILTALLALPAVFAVRHTIAAPAAQDGGRSDVAKREKQKKPRTPRIFGASPANDNCAGAIAINACPFTDTKNTAGAGDEVGEPQSSCTAQANSVWYTLAPSANIRTVTVDTCGSDFDTALMVWQVDAGQPCNFATFVDSGCNDDFDGCGDGFQSSVSFTAAAGATYKIQAGGFDGETGNLTVNLACEEILCPNIVINGIIGSGDPGFLGTQSSGNQTGRLNRNGIASSCAAPKTCLIFDPANLRPFDSYSIANTNVSDACVNVNLNVTDQAGCNLESIAYLTSFDPANICTNYFADPGLSSGTGPTVPTNFSFVLPAGQTVVLVVHGTSPAVGAGCHYILTVTGNLCAPAAAFDTCLQDDSNASTVFVGNAATGAYSFCCGGTTYTGVARVTRRANLVTFQQDGTDRRILAKIDMGAHAGSASVQSPPGRTRCTIADRNTTNNTCTCQ